METEDKLQLSNVLSEGYGIIPKKLMKDKELTIEAKAIYAFLASYTGKGDTSFPSLGLITSSLGISRQRYNKHRELLVEKGYIDIKRVRDKTGKLGKNIFKINLYNPLLQKPTMEKPTLEKPTLENATHNNNSSNNNSINNNKEIKDNALFESWWDLYNKKKARPKALSAFNTALKKHDYKTIEAGTIKYLKSIEDKQYQSYPAKFLNQEQYMDDYENKANNIYDSKKTTSDDKASVGLDYLDGM